MVAVVYASYRGRCMCAVLMQNASAATSLVCVIRSLILELMWVSHAAVGDVILGAGETSGVLDKSCRRFRLGASDALGYDAEKCDPL